MKLKLSVAAAAVAMAFAGQASAITEATTGNGGLFLTAWDSVGGVQAYARDLNVVMDTFIANPTGNLTFAADPLFASTFAGIASADILWNVVAGDNVVDPNRLLSTAAGAPGSINNAALQNGLIRVNNLLVDLNGRVGCASGGSCAITDNTDPEWPGGGNWGSSFGGNIANITNTTSLGGSLQFWLIAQNGLNETSTVSQTVRTQFFLGGDPANAGASWTLAANGSLNYTGAAEQPPAVPIPAAVWLFGSGLLGLVGVARRRKEKAV